MTVSFNANAGTNYNTEPKKNRLIGKSIGATLVGSAGVGLATTPISLLMLQGLKKAHNYNEAEITSIKSAAEAILQNSGLSAKGVHIKYLPETSKDFLTSLINPVEAISQGNNACFLNKDLKGTNLFTGQKVIIENAGTILMPEKQIQGSVFHEIGHAHNFNNSKILKFIQNNRKLWMFAPLAFLVYGAFTEKSKPKNGNTELTGAQKTNNFLRDNAGKLAFAISLPMVAEELIATIKGHNFAKKLVSKEVAGKALKGNLFGLATYTLTAIVAGLSAYTAVKLKDKAVEKRDKKAQLNIAA